MKVLFSMIVISISPLSYAATTVLPNSTFAVDEGVAFTLGNDGASDYLFSWTDSSGTQFERDDPTLILTAGQTYTFQRTSPLHPFAILDNLAVTEVVGSLVRTSSDAEITAAILSPGGNDLIANPSGPAISWTPTSADVGDYFYTCLVTSHTSMTGRIQVVPEPSSSLLVLVGGAIITLRRKR